MPKILVETPSFDPDIVVPEGTDPRVDAADVVEALAQKLANRSQFVKEVTDNAARVDTTNTFEEITTFLQRLLLSVIDAAPGHPVMDVPYTASEDSQTWKPILRMALVQRTSGSASATLYTRHISGNERLILVTNAEWTGTQWHQNDSSKSSTAILFTSTGSEALQICRMPAGAANWSTWSFGTLVAGDFVYQKTRSIPIPLGNSSTDYDNISGSTYGGVLAQSTGGAHHFALRFPTNMGSGGLEIMHYKADTAASVFEVIALTAPWGSPGTVTVATMGTLQSVTTSGFVTTTISVGPYVVGTEYRLRWVAANLGDRLLAARVNGASDVGPLNML